MANCCYEFSSLYLKVINFCVLALSLVFLGFGAFLAAQLGDDLKNVDLNAPVVVTLSLGAIMFVFSLIGILGACWDSKTLLFVYIIGTLVLSLGVLASGIALLSYTGRLDRIRGGSIDEQADALIVDFELAVFVNCCGEDKNNIPVCADDPTFPCVSDVNQFNDFLGFIGSKTCGTLQEAKIDGTPVVGDPSTGACGGGDRVTFVNNINQFVEDNLQSLGIANIIAGIILMLLLITACVLLWSKDDDKERRK